MKSLVNPIPLLCPGDRGLDPFEGMRITIELEVATNVDGFDDDDLDEVVSEADI